MKYLIKSVSLLFLIGLLTFSESFAQNSVIQPELSKKEAKIANNVAKSKVDLAKANTNLLRYQQDYNKKRTKFQKDNSKGKLSPNTVAKHGKILDNLHRKIDRELATIDKLEKYILKNDPGSGLKNLP